MTETKDLLPIYNDHIRFSFTNLKLVQIIEVVIVLVENKMFFSKTA